MKQQHYNAQGKPECFILMENIFGRQALIHFCYLNAYKYEYRKDLKQQKEQDLQKASFYKSFARNLEIYQHCKIEDILAYTRKETINEPTIKTNQKNEK